MPQPTSSDMHIRAALADFTIAAANEDANFIGGNATSIMEVEKQTDSYYVYDSGDWNRIEMKPRGSSMESEGSGWTLSNTNYQCPREAVHKDFDEADETEADEAIDTEADATSWMGNQWKMRLDQKINSAIMVAATWSTDIDGVAAGPTLGQEVLQWNDSSSDPQADHTYLASVVQGKCGREPNVMIVGRLVHARLLTNPVVRDAIKHTQFTGVKDVNAKLASFFGLRKYIVGGAFNNTAEENATDSFAYLINQDDVWCGYLSDEVKKRTYTAWKIFGYKFGGRATKGVVVRKIPIPTRTSNRYEVESWHDVRITAADAGYFIDGAVAT